MTELNSISLKNHMFDPIKKSVLLSVAETSDDEMKHALPVSAEEARESAGLFSQQKKKQPFFQKL